MEIGIVLMIEGNEKLGIPRYREIRDMARQAEAAGFDSLWIYDHLLLRGQEPPAGQWECFVFLSALAEATERLTLGTLVACTAFRNPALLAKIAVTLDEVSNGRFVLGVGAGWNEAEFKAFGFPFDHRVDRFQEALEIIVPLVREGHVDFRGRYVEAPECEMVLRGPRPGGPPILIGANGPRMTRLAAKYADELNTGVDPDKAEQQRQELAALCSEAGRDPATLSLSTPVWTAFPDLGPIPDHMRDSTYPSAEAVAQRLRAFDRAGVDHVMIDFRPNNSASLARLAEALEIFRDSEGS